MRPIAALLLLFVLVAPAAGQEDSSTRERLEVLRDDGGDGLVDPPPTEHLGWGTLEDVFVDLGAGAAVSTLSGNLVVHLEPVARPAVPVGLRMALTYNHQDGLGASDLGPGWSWDLGRFVAAGAWGDRLFIDGDGFRDSFWAGPPPTMEELGRVADDVVARWRQDTPATERRRLGGVRALRELLASDPATLGAMRLRYLGPPTMEDGDPTTFRSFARGGRTLESTDDGPVLQQVDGTVETYGKTGLLQQVAPPMGAPWDFDYTGGRLTSVSSSGRTEWEINRDSRGRIIDFDTPAGGRASIDYLGPLVRSITGSMGTWRFGYDERSRVTSVDGPGGSVRVRYDGDGRVQAASGPLRSVEFGAGADAEAFVVDVRGLAAGPMAVRWEPDARRRTVERGGAVVDSVTFAPRAALPIRIDRDGSPVAVAWSEAGELVGIGRGDVDVTWERGAAGALERVDASGQIASISRETERRLTWMDPSTRATTLERDQAGRLRWLRDRDVDLGVHWSGAGGLSGVRLPGGIMVGLPLDGARVGSLEWGGVRSGVRRDEQGRITRYEGPTGLPVDLPRTAAGAIRSVADDRAAIDLQYDARGLLTGWSGPEGTVALGRDERGRPTGVSVGSEDRWALRWTPDGRPMALDRSGARRAVTFDEDGPVSWERPGGARSTVRRNDDGHVVELADTALGALGLGRDDTGYTVDVQRGVGRWRIGRDRTGRANSISNPVGGRTDFTLDDAGRVRALVTPERQAWRLRRDARGRVTAARSPEGIWTIGRRPDGHPREFRTPTGRHALLRHDARGRPVELQLPGAAKARASWGMGAPTRLGEIGWRIGPTGALVGWGDAGDPELPWFLDRDERGRGRSLRRDGDARATLRRDHAERLSGLGRWALDWGDDGLRALALGDGDDAPRWVINRDPAGRAQELRTPSGETLRIRRDQQGDVLDVVGSELQARVARDQGGRIRLLTLDAGASESSIAVERDELGRVTAAQRTRDGAILDALRVDWLDVPPDEAGVLAKLFDVQTDEEPIPRKPSGSARVTGGGRTIDATLTAEGTGTRADPTALVPGLAPRIGSVRWGTAGTRPSPIGGAADLAGDAASVARLWGGMRVRATDLAWMPEGVAESVRAWSRASDRFTDQALLPADSGGVDAGALVEPVPGAGALVPGPSDSQRLTLMELLVLSGDVPADALRVADMGDAAAQAWTAEVPGATALWAVRRRLMAPSAPPMTGLEQIADVAPHGFGVLTTRGDRLERSRRWDVRPALEGMPAGLSELLPGALPDGALCTTPRAGRCADWEALSDDPLGVGEAALGRAHTNSTLLALQTLAGHGATSLGGLLPDPAADESWLIELPSGARVVVNGRGQLLSVDAAGRLHEAMRRDLAAKVVDGLLRGTIPDRGPGSINDASDAAPWLPRYLPERGDVVESRWGLVPAAPEVPLDARARPVAAGWPAAAE